jgi:hypothetical protein
MIHITDTVASCAIRCSLTSCYRKRSRYIRSILRIRNAFCELPMWLTSANGRRKMAAETAGLGPDRAQCVADTLQERQS